MTQTQKMREVTELPHDKDRKKSGAINGRLSGALRERLSKISQAYGPNDARMLEDALTALADYVELSGGYTWPFKIVAASSTRRPANYSVNEADDSLFSRLEALLAAEAARRRAIVSNPPRG